MKSFSLIAVALAVMFSLATPVQAQQKTLFGTLLGAAAGGFGGAQIGGGRGKLITTALGTLLGAGVGRSVGQSLDRVDRYDRSVYNQRRYNRRIYSRQNIPRPYTYRQTSQRRFHSVCRSGVIREYQTVVVIAGRERPAWGRACYMPDGSWRKL